jgi:hypothetical protein
MNTREAAYAARLIADRSINPVDHRLALALEHAVWAEEHQAQEQISTEGIPAWAFDAIVIERPPDPGGV